MFNKVAERIGYFLSILFLGITIYSSTFGNEQFTIKSLAGTDALTLYGSVMALITMLSLKFHCIRKLFRYALLKLNVLDYNYTLKIQLLTEDNISVVDMFNKCITLLEKELNIKEVDYNINYKSVNQIKSYIRTMATNFNINSSFNNNSVDRLYSIEINGVTKFSRMDKNIKKTVSVIESIMSNQYKIKYISLSINKKSTEAKITTDGLLYSRKEVHLISSNIVLRANEDSDITLNNVTGISLNSKSIIKFLSSYEVVQDLLIS